MSFPADVKLIDRFLQCRRFRHSDTPKNYCGTLRNFQQFIAIHYATEVLTASILQRWLKVRSLRCATYTLASRARIVERYLQWLWDQELIPENPFAILHKRYGAKTAPIVNALVQEDADRALELLRTTPRFASHLGKVMEQHINHMQSLGYRYKINERLLLRFDRFLQQDPSLAQWPLETLVKCWSDEKPSVHRLHESQQAGRIISKALHRLDPAVPILSIDAGVGRAARQGDRRAHLYSDVEIQKIMACALSYPSPKSPLRPLSLFTMLMLAYCSGLRGGEIASLKLMDVDLHEQSIEIHETKFFKHRCIPLAPGVMIALENYLNAREHAGAPTSPQSELFYSVQTGHGYALGTMQLMLTDVLRRSGVKPPRGTVGPRIHDLRHTMVGHRMREWYASGINPQSRLPYLATYLGHKDICSTLVYLDITPELLQQASERFRENGAAVLHALEDSQ
jgi:integrase/recombinase XerD